MTENREDPRRYPNTSEGEQLCSVMCRNANENFFAEIARQNGHASYTVYFPYAGMEFPHE